MPLPAPPIEERSETLHIPPESDGGFWHLRAPQNRNGRRRRASDRCRCSTGDIGSTPRAYDRTCNQLECTSSARRRRIHPLDSPGRLRGRCPATRTPCTVRSSGSRSMPRGRLTRRRRPSRPRARSSSWRSWGGARLPTWRSTRAVAVRALRRSSWACRRRWRSPPAARCLRRASSRSWRCCSSWSRARSGSRAPRRSRSAGCCSCASRSRCEPRARTFRSS